MFSMNLKRFLGGSPSMPWRKLLSTPSSSGSYRLTKFEQLIYKKDVHGKRITSVPYDEKAKVKAKNLVYRSNLFMVIALIGAGYYIWRGKTFKERGELDLNGRNIHKHDNLLAEKE